MSSLGALAILQDLSCAGSFIKPILISGVFFFFFFFFFFFVVVVVVCLFVSKGNLLDFNFYFTSLQLTFSTVWRP